MEHLSSPSPASTRMPMELIELVIREMDDPSTLAAMMRVSRRMYEVASPLLYREIAVHGDDLGLLHVGANDEEIAGCDDGVKDNCNGAVETDHTAHSQRILNDESPFSNHRPRTSKVKLLTLVRHMDIFDIPSLQICKDLISLTKDGTMSRHLSPSTMSLRPTATWKLMQYDIGKEKDGPPHPLLVYLDTLNAQHLCIQLPIMDQHLEDSLLPNRNITPRKYHDISGVRLTLRNAFLKSRDYGGNLKDLFGFSRLHCETIIIHNFTTILTDRAFAGLSDSTKTVRLFYRPCSGSDGEVTDKIWDHYCYTHLPHNTRFMVNPTPSIQTRSAPQNAEFIDMDWVRGNYDPNRENKSLKLVRRIESGDWGKKSFKMANEVNACRCCGKHQLSAVEGSIRQVNQE